MRVCIYHRGTVRGKFITVCVCVRVCVCACVCVCWLGGWVCVVVLGVNPLSLRLQNFILDL
jgi:hypothetical protein